MMFKSNLRQLSLAVLTACAMTCGAQVSLAATASAVATASASIEQGKKLWEEGKVEEAQKRFEAAIGADPKSVEAHMKLAGLHITRMNFSAAISTYRNVLGIDANNAKAWMGMGMCYLHTGAKELAKASFEEALRIEPSRKQQLQPILAQIDEKLEAKNAQIEADMPRDVNHQGKAAAPTTKPAGKTNSVASQKPARE